MMYLTGVAKVIIKEVREFFLCHLWENVSNCNVKIFSTESRSRRSICLLLRLLLIIDFYMFVVTRLNTNS